LLISLVRWMIDSAGAAVAGKPAPELGGCAKGLAGGSAAERGGPPAK
jgi:hypothetical protein